MAPPVSARRRRRLVLACAGVAGLLAATATALLAFAALPGPLDLAEAARMSAVVLDREGRLLRPFAKPDGRWRLPLGTSEVDPRLLALLKVYEDARFDRHPGIDPLALARAGSLLVRHGRVVSGASTLTMQVARLLEPRKERSVAAKLRQIVRAVELERRFTKAEILDLYLVLAPYGGNLEGVRAASLAYFGKEPRRLSHAEAALLVALPQAPEARRPDRAPEAARRARDRVLDRAVASGLIPAAEAEAARRESVPEARRPFPMLAAHAADTALQERPGARVHRLTLDARAQAVLEALVRERVERLGPGLTGAVVVLDNATGEVRAQVGGAGYLDRERAGSVDLTRALRSPGSALKPFIYALAFEQGLAHPETLVEDRPSRWGVYQPENFDLSFQGTLTARRALQQSLNVPAVDLLAELGPARLVARLRGAGADIALPGEAAPGLSVGLGGVGVTLTDLTRLYSALARRGEAPALRRRLDGEAEGGRQARAAALTEEVAAWYVADILRGAPPPDNAAANRLAFKTGTSYGYRDAWALGFDRRLTIGVWVGRPDGGAVPGLIGRIAAAPILFDAYARLGAEPEPIPQPPHALVGTNAGLPPPLRQARRGTGGAPASTTVAAVPVPLKIAFPLDGSRVELGLTRPGDEVSPLALKAHGGVPPLTWMVNGAPVSAGQPRRQAAWQPDGAGFARVSVIDARGHTDSVLVRLE